MRNAKTKALALAAALALPGVASAQDASIPISANLTFTSDYVFRGISQTDERFAVQGGFDWESAGTGIYAGTWASNVDFGSDTSVELDAYIGWAKTWGDWGLDLGYLHYNYPGESSLNTDEVYITGAWKWLSASYYSTVSSEAFGIMDARGSGYFNIAAEYTFPMGLAIGGSWGTTKYSGSTLGVNNSNADYDDYKLYLGYSDATYTGLDYELAWTDNDINDPRPAIAEDRVFFSISKSF